MPKVPADQVNQALGIDESNRRLSLSGPQPEADRPEDRSVIAAAFGEGNTVVNAYRFLTNHFSRPEPEEDYSFFRDDPHLSHGDHEDEFFFDSGSRAESLMIRRRLDAEQRDNETLEANPVTGIAASLLAGAADPTIFMPTIKAVQIARASGNFARVGNFARNAGIGAANAFLGAAAAETVLQGTQLSRTAERTAATLVIAPAFGAAITSALAPLLGRVGAEEIADLAQREIDEGFIGDAIGLDPKEMIGLTEEGYRLKLVQAIEDKAPEAAKLIRQGSWERPSHY